MPMHDWTRIPAGIYHHFHGRWIYAIADALNQGVLPKGYYALAEQVTRQVGPDVLMLERPVMAGANGPLAPAASGAALHTVATAPPAARFAAKAKPRPQPRPQRRLTIRHTSDHRMVALIELVSPGNKAARHAFRAFVSKAVGVLDAGFHLLVIDPFPPGKRDPNGVHAAIWHDLVGEQFALPPEKPLTLVSYSAGEAFTAYVNPVAVGDPLPDMPLFLDPERYVSVPLEAAYQAAWATFPEEWRTVLTAG